MTASPTPHVPCAVEGGVTRTGLARPEGSTALAVPILDAPGR